MLAVLDADAGSIEDWKPGLLIALRDCNHRYKMKGRPHVRICSNFVMIYSNLVRFRSPRYFQVCRS